MSFIVQNGTNRAWTTSEEVDLSSDYGVMTPGVKVIVHDDFALVHASDDEYINCLLWAIGDNLYVAQPTKDDGMIYWSNSLKDAFDFCAEVINLAER